jgi:8-oxo-dGTP pyrophosphatase MutT (NUDIX family)
MTSDARTAPTDDEPVPLRPAATLMLVRDGEHDEAPLEVLMVRRNLQSDFIGGAYVFPGGGLDAADGGPEVASRSRGLDDATASRILGLPHGGLAYWVAAVRECFEEAGVLLAYHDVGGAPRDAGDGPGSVPPLLSLETPKVARRFAAHRREVNAGRRHLVEICKEEVLVLALDRVHYFSHWVTPEGVPRRYDTRFFVAAAPSGQDPRHDAAETVASEWIRPGDALQRFKEGDIELIFPTIRTLQAIGRFETSGELAAAAAVAGHVPVTLPRVVADGRGVRIMLPGDPGYDSAAASPDVPLDVATAVRAASRAAVEGPPPPS